MAYAAGPPTVAHEFDALQRDDNGLRAQSVCQLLRPRCRSAPGPATRLYRSLNNRAQLWTPKSGCTEAQTLPWTVVHGTGQVAAARQASPTFEPPHADRATCHRQTTDRLFHGRVVRRETEPTAASDR